MVRLNELRTPLARGDDINFVTTTLQIKQQHHHHQHNDDHRAIATGATTTDTKPLKAVTNSPELHPRPACLQPPPLLWGLDGTISPEVTGAAAHGPLKKAFNNKTNDNRGKTAHAGRAHSLRHCSFVQLPVNTPPPQRIHQVAPTLSLPLQPPVGAANDELLLDLLDSSDTDSSLFLPEATPAALNSPIVAESSLLPDADYKPPPSPTAAAADDDESFSWCDPIIADGLALPLSDLIPQELLLDDGPDGFTMPSMPADLPIAPTSPQTPRNLVTIRYGERSVAFEYLRSSSSAELRAKIATRFALGANKPFVLRTPGDNGCIVPVACCASVSSIGATFCLEVPTADENAAMLTAEMGEQPPSPVDEKTNLRWVQEPPHSTCHWLTAKPSDLTPATAAAAAAGGAGWLHCFDPAPAVAFKGIESAELSALLAQATVTLWTPRYTDVSKHLKAGPVEVIYSADGDASLRWPAMAITELPNNVTGEAMGAAVSNSHHGGRGGKGWFHLRVEIPTIGRLWLKNHAGTAPAQIILKHRRCVETGRWREREIGPYADHSLCVATGSHIDEGTGKKRCKESCCFGKRGKRCAGPKQTKKMRLAAEASGIPHL